MSHKSPAEQGSTVEGSVSEWIQSLRNGDETAAARIWSRYAELLMSMARSRLRRTPRQVADEEDIVVAAFDACFRAFRKGRYEEILNRDDFFRLIIKITERKLIDQKRHLFAKKRVGLKGQSRDSSLSADNDSASLKWEDQVLSREPSPEFAAAFADEFQRLVGLLGDTLATVLKLRLEGHSNVEIAKITGCAVSTVERYFRLIRKTWEGEAADG